MAETFDTATGGWAVADGTAPAPAKNASKADVVAWLYRRHHKKVFALALRYGCGDRAFAEDVVQDVFIRLINAQERLRDADDLGGWLHRVTANCALNKLRNERVRGLLRLQWLRSDDVSEGRQDKLVDVKDQHRALMIAIRALPPKERIALVMHRVDGATQDEIGVVLGHNKSAICKILQRAEARLRAAGVEVDHG